MRVIKNFLVLATTLTLIHPMLTVQSVAKEYKTVKVQVSKVASTVILGGTVVPYKEVTLSAQISGQLKFIGGQEGDSFKSGEKLVSIDDDDLQARRRAAVAQARRHALDGRMGHDGADRRVARLRSGSRIAHRAWFKRRSNYPHSRPCARPD